MYYYVCWLGRTFVITVISWTFFAWSLRHPSVASDLIKKIGELLRLQLSTRPFVPWRSANGGSHSSEEWRTCSGERVAWPVCAMLVRLETVSLKCVGDCSEVEHWEVADKPQNDSTLCHWVCVLGNRGILLDGDHDETFDSVLRGV